MNHVRSFVSATLRYLRKLWDALTGPDSINFWRIWAVLGVLIAAIGFGRSEHAINKIDEENKARVQAQCEQALDARDEAEQDLIDLATSFSTNPADLVIVVNIIHNQYDNKETPPSCVPLLKSPENYPQSDRLHK